MIQAKQRVDRRIHRGGQSGRQFARGGGPRIDEQIARAVSISFDTSALIYYLEKIQPYRAWLEPVIESMVAGRRWAFLSVIAEAELLVLPMRQGNRAALDRLASLLTHSSITTVSLARALAAHAASCRARLQRSWMHDLVLA